MKHMALGMSPGHSHIATAALLFGCVLLVACHAEPSKEDNAHAKQVLDDAQKHKGLVIGQEYGGHLEYFDAERGFASTTASGANYATLSALEIPPGDSSKTPSTPKAWNVSCHKTNCLVQSGEQKELSFTIQLNHLLTPIYWSSDVQLGFYVKKGPTWRSPARCSMEDERDIVVIDVVSGSQGIVRTVCGGFPYDQLRWFNLKG